MGSWVGPDGDRLKTPRRLQTEEKYLVYVAVSLSGFQYFKISYENINSENYIQFLTEMEQYFQTNGNIRFENMSLIQDNARPHVSRQTLDFIGQKNIRLLKQPPYSPDTNMCDRFIFPCLEALRANKQNFDGREDLSNFLSNELPNFTANKMRKAFDKMKEDFQKIIDNDGHYL